jgi:hypothetical protein
VASRYNARKAELRRSNASYSRRALYAQTIVATYRSSYFSASTDDEGDEVSR